jgi:cyclophilin family peptidyl-prolyl cis-trans isomerase
MMLDLAMGSDHHGGGRLGSSSSSPFAWAHASPQYNTPRLLTSPRRPSSRYSLNQTRSSLSSVTSLVYIVAALSWISALYLSRQTNIEFASLQSKHVGQNHQYQIQLASMNDLVKQIQTKQSEIQHLQETRQSLEHELAVLQTLHDDGHDVVANAEDEPTTTMIQSNESVELWLQHRQDEMKHRIDHLIQYTQNFSHQQVIEQWGEGPHRVAFTVEYNNEHGHIYNRQFLVELASVHDMPHSVHFFLEMVAMKLWDHTVLLHHEKIEHLIAAVPIDFRYSQYKHSHLAYLGWKNMGFPEYHPKHTHNKYTLGFANKGPTWYINTVNNVVSHGPGGQPKKQLLGDADPCFGTVIEGTDVVDDLIQFGLHQKQTELDPGHPLVDDPHTWTHLIKVELVSAGPS